MSFYVTKLPLNYRLNNIFLDDGREIHPYILLIEKVNHCQAFADCVRPRTWSLGELCNDSRLPNVFHEAG